MEWYMKSAPARHAGGGTPHRARLRDRRSVAAQPSPADRLLSKAAAQRWIVLGTPATPEQPEHTRAILRPRRDRRLFMMGSSFNSSLRLHAVHVSGGGFTAADAVRQQGTTQQLKLTIPRGTRRGPLLAQPRAAVTKTASRDHDGIPDGSR
jgi:hypothetical protein